MVMYLCMSEPPAVVKIPDGGKDLRIELILESTRFIYLNNGSESIRIETPVLDIVLASDRIINHFLDYLQNLFTNKPCFEAKLRNGVIEV